MTNAGKSISLLIVMKSKTNDMGTFDVELKSALRSAGKLFPTTDAETNHFLAHSHQVDVPAKYRTPDFLFSNNLRPVFHLPPSTPETTTTMTRWALAARNGKTIPSHILKKMQKDKEDSNK